MRFGVQFRLETSGLELESQGGGVREVLARPEKELCWVGPKACLVQVPVSHSDASGSTEPSQPVSAYAVLYLSGAGDTLLRWSSAAANVLPSASALASRALDWHQQQQQCMGTTAAVSSTSQALVVLSQRRASLRA